VVRGKEERQCIWRCLHAYRKLCKVQTSIPARGEDDSGALHVRFVLSADMLMVQGVLQFRKA